MNKTFKWKEFCKTHGADLEGISALICGVCVKVCPFGKKKSFQMQVAAARGLKNKEALIP